MSARIKPGDCVEYTDEDLFDYTLGDKNLARYGIAVENERADGSIMVKRADRSLFLVPGICVQAYAWLGWIPDGLEEIYDEIMNHYYPDTHDEWGEPL